MDLADSLTFKPNKRIARIVTDIYSLYKSNVSQHETISVYVQAYESDEGISLASDADTYRLLDYLDSEGIAEASIGKSKINPSKVKEDHYVVTELDVVVKDPKKLKQLNSFLQKQSYEQNTVSFSEKGTLTVNGETVAFGVGTPAYDLLHLIFIDGESRDDIWSYSDSDVISLAEVVYRSGNRSVAEHCRDTGNYVNRRVKEKTGIKDLLLVNSKSIQLNPDFV